VNNCSQPNSLSQKKNISSNYYQTSTVSLQQDVISVNNNMHHHHHHHHVLYFEKKLTDATYNNARNKILQNKSGFLCKTYKLL